VHLHMLALYRADRRTEALDLYTRTRAYLAEQLGLEPGARLRELHQAILRGLPLPPLAADSGSEPTTDGRTNASPPDSPVSNDLADLVDAVLRLAPGLAPGRRPQPLGRTEIRLFRWSDPAGPACRLGITTGTIRRVKHADIWVNSENTDMEMSRHTDFSVSGIIRYFGARRDRSGRVTEDLIADELANLVAGRRPVAPASAIVTGAGALADSHNVAYVIHVAAVFGTPGAGFRQVANVGDCVTNALTEADRLAATGKRAHSIVFPLLGAGSAGAAALPTAVALVNAAVDYLTGTPGTALRAVHFLAYSADELTVLEQAIAAIPELVPDEG